MTEGKWSHVTDLNMNRSALKACVLDGLPNSYRFTFYGHQTEHGDACREPPQVSIFGHNTVEEMFAVERGQASGSPDEDGGSRVMDCVGEVVIDMEYNAVRGDVSNGNDNNNNNNDDDDNDVGSSDDDDDDGGDGSDVFQQHGAGPGYGGFSMHGLNQFAILFDDQIDWRQQSLVVVWLLFWIITLFLFIFLFFIWRFFFWKIFLWNFWRVFFLEL